MRFTSVGDLLTAAPCDLGATDWVTISADDVQAFANATRAWEWIHLDAERAAREAPFGGPVAHGFLTLSLATCFQTQLLQLPEHLFGINYGVRSARFPDAVPVGSRVRAHGRLVEAEAEGDDGARLVVALRYERDGGEKPPCVAELISLAVPAIRPPDRDKADRPSQPH